DMDGAASSDRVEILASNSGNGDALLVELEEEAAGRFAGVVSTGYGAGAVNDDLLQVQAGDVAEFSVQDRLDKSGTSGLRVTQSAVVASEGGEVYLESLSEDDTPPSAHPAGNRVLHLDGRDSYVELPGGIFDGLTAATVEAWVRWDDWDSFSQWFAFGADGEWRAMGINPFDRTSILQFFIYPDKAPLRVLRAKSDLPLGQWCHMAAVSGPGGMRLYLNGMLLAHHGYEGSFAVVGEGWSNYLGKSNWAENRFFRGGLDEVRVWSSERSQAQIRTDMERRLRGDEVGLVGLWNFDDGAAADRSPAGHHGRLRGRARSVPAPFPGADAVVQPAVLRGVVRDENGMPLADARVRLKDADGDSLSILAWGDGHYGVVVLGSGTYALSVLPENELLPPREVSLQTGRTSFLNQRPAVDPVARWRAEGDADDGRGGHHGALLNGATFAPGLVGQAFHLDGVDDLIRVPHAPVLNPQGGFSLVAWIFPTADRAAYIYSKWGDADEWVDQRAYSLRTLPGLKLSFMISDNVLESDRPVPEFESSPNAIKLNTWNQVVAVYDHSAGARRIYVNGALVAQREDQPVNITRSIADLIIGTYLPAPHRNPSESFAGLIDEISIHDRTLTEIEIQRLYSAHAQARWSGEGNANDATRGGNDGALVKQVTFAPGVVGQAFAFDGQDGYVQLSSLIGHVGTADFTTEWWLWCAPQSPGEQPLLAKHLDENNALEVRLDEEKRV
ncbi:MAG: hypothetical protein HOC74_02925, partial [Gemmatimonadetes bacterium]|nr:hypothetical protein [Gemmatimonadota bacterium]